MVNALEHHLEVAPESEQLLEDSTESNYPKLTEALNNYQNLTVDALNRHRSDLKTCYENSWESSCSLLLNTFYESLVKETLEDSSDFNDRELFENLREEDLKLDQNLFEEIYKEKVLYQHELPDLNRKYRLFDLDIAIDIYEKIIEESNYDVQINEHVTEVEQSSDRFGLP